MSSEKLDKALDRLAGLFESGELQISTFQADFINNVCDEIENLRNEIESLVKKSEFDKSIYNVTVQQRDAAWVEVERLKERMKCNRCGSDGTTLDAHFHCSTCWANQEAKLEHFVNRVQYKIEQSYRLKDQRDEARAVASDLRKMCAKDGYVDLDRIMETWKISD